MLGALTMLQKRFPSLKTVRDAKHTILIEVSEADAKSRGIKKHDKCALAEACKRQLKADSVLVSIRTAYVVKASKAIRYAIPQYVAREIVSFDRKAGFTPGLYELKAPCPSQKLGARSHRANPHGAPKWEKGGLAKRFTIHKTYGVRMAIR